MTHGQAREGTPLWEQDEVIEKAWEVIVHEMGLLPDEAEPMHEELARAVLAAVGPHIAAQAWDEGTFAQARNYTGPNPYAREDADR